MWMCSSALGIARSSCGSRSREMESKFMMGGSLPSRHLAFDALDEEVDAAEELVVGDLVLLQHLLAVVGDDRALPDRVAAVLQAGLDLLDLVLQLGGHLVGNRHDVDRALL